MIMKGIGHSFINNSMFIQILGIQYMVKYNIIFIPIAIENVGVILIILYNLFLE